jgi:hypothetical protein
MFLAIKNVCVDPAATLLFHAAPSAHESDHAPYPERNARMAGHYNAALRRFVLANHYMDSFAFHAIPGRDIIRKFRLPAVRGEVTGQLPWPRRAQRYPGLYPRRLFRISLRSSRLCLLPFNFVLRGLDPRIHPTSKESFEADGWPAQARP